MNADDITKAQYAAIRNKVGEMVVYLSRLDDRMSYKGFPTDDPLKLVVTNALIAVQQMHKEVLSRSFDVKAISDSEKPSAADLLFTRTSAPRKHEKHRLERPKRESH